MPALPTNRVRAEVESRLGPDEHMPDSWDHYGPGNELLRYAAELLVRAERAEHIVKDGGGGEQWRK